MGAAPAALETAHIDPAQLATEIEAELRGNILPFWLNHARDRDRGGYYGEIRNDLSIKRNAPRGGLLTARILWTFSAAYRRYHDPAMLEMARWAYADLQDHFLDQKFGGYYWRMSAKGAPLDERKITYLQSFVIYGLSEYYRASGDATALDRAMALFRILEERAHDRAHDGYFEEFRRDWTISRDRSPRGSAMGSLGQKSQNTHLHLLEALTNLNRVTPDETVRLRLRELAELLATRVLDVGSHHLRLFFEEDWTPVSHDYSYGHDIEYAWLSTEAAEQLGDASLLSTTRKNALAIAAATLREGVDADGGIASEGDEHGILPTPKGRYREWWEQSEATVGFLNAYQISGDARFLAAAQHTWTFIQAHVVDHQQGEWFHGVTSEGRVVNPIKAGFWKCPYHNSRACLELVERLRALPPASQLP